MPVTSTSSQPQSSSRPKLSIKKVLIANRGEIAVRVARACRELGIRSVAIYSEADRYALHVKKADESHCLGSDPLQGYLNPHQIVNLAVETGCDALHPGYGFLSENAELAEICAQRGVKFIGPSADVIRQMGDKTEARNSAKRASVPVTPGSEGNLRDLEHAVEVAAGLGYPVMLKATSGGGGRGIRRCNDEKDLRSNYQRVISEATKAFGRAEVFLEKCIVDPRHIEVQVLADAHGGVVHLYERDCSIQRRNQKLIELAPSPQLSNEQRHYVGELAVKVAREVGYENAGTVEFLLDHDGSFYFMEMNTRVQVEHTITEQITGIDIVKTQIRIAAGEPLPFLQADISYRGFAAQFRINAEDPKNGFLPSFGRISRYYSPGGPGVRTDAAIYTGYTIPPYYDSMCAKLIVWNLTWEDMLERAERALEDMQIYGIRTTIPYYREILRHPEFRAGDFNTGFVEAHPELINYSIKRRPESLAAALAAAVAAQAGM
ncbi:acetyl-CoA carboxylase biotin carboxylase subunit [Hahella sp. CR1]|uniref:acetyl-CoA carboxylase biotin carboxylase subunit n=1 Tax=unclassified Hahella TaxID=2624107 RepID=UPI0024430537|nr:acetyl-CoA carboxylase biotin carboxylase subunit [Hahella sp. CR1]MDG9666785.1 acetyl-CoA carboxylase biotin carboxylase subunit [Hahella sp. CR1]